MECGQCDLKKGFDETCWSGSSCLALEWLKFRLRCDARKRQMKETEAAIIGDDDLVNYELSIYGFQRERLCCIGSRMVILSL